LTISSAIVAMIAGGMLFLPLFVIMVSLASKLGSP
jgi:hypothetical protein